MLVGTLIGDNSGVWLMAFDGGYGLGLDGWKCNCRVGRTRYFD